MPMNERINPSLEKIKGFTTSGWQEFKQFAFKGNMIDLAVAVVLGAAFGNVVNVLVKAIFMPLLSYFVPNQGGYLAWHIGRLQIGAFIGEVINFLVIALAVFIIIVKLLGTLMKKAVPPAPAAAPVTRECPFCLSMIPIKAVRCAHCTSEVPKVEEAVAPQ